jgi:hypothetical protein
VRNEKITERKETKRNEAEQNETKQTATVRNLLQSSKYYYQVCESSNSTSCLKFHIEKNAEV